MDDSRIIYVTTPDPATAESIGTAVVEGGLAACANILPAMRSIYRWQGAIERADETILLIKTVDAQVEAVFAAVRARHPYETPALFALALSHCDPAFAAWLRVETRAPESGRQGAP